MLVGDWWAASRLFVRVLDGEILLKSYRGRSGVRILYISKGFPSLFGTVKVRNSHSLVIIHGIPTGKATGMFIGVALSCCLKTSFGIDDVSAPLKCGASEESTCRCNAAVARASDGVQSVAPVV